MQCKNCENEFHGKYCNNCGQRSDVHRINLHYLWHDLQHGFFHVNKGILFSIRELFIRPGNAIRDYLHGKRVKHFQPLSMVIVLSSIFAICINFLDQKGKLVSESNLSPEIIHFKHWLLHHYPLFVLLALPVISLGTYLFFKKQGYNYFEIIVFTAFKQSQRLILNILLAIVIYFTPNVTIQSVEVIQILLGSALWFFTNVQFYNKLHPIKTIVISLIWEMLYSAIIILLIAIGISINLSI